MRVFLKNLPVYLLLNFFWFVPQLRVAEESCVEAEARVKELEKQVIFLSSLVFVVKREGLKEFAGSFVSNGDILNERHLKSFACRIGCCSR